MSRPRTRHQWNPWAAALASTDNCASFNERLANYEAASPTNKAAARIAAELLLFGAERLATGPKFCDDADAPPPLNGEALRKGVSYLERAVSMGDAASARMLASLTLAGFVSTETKDLKAIAPPHSTGPVVASRLGDAVHTNNTERAVQLLLQAAMQEARACLALSNRYRFGEALPIPGSGGVYAKCAAAIAKDEFHTPGEQLL